MSTVSGKPSVSPVRWVARILGTFIGFSAFWEIIEWLQYNLTGESQARTHNYLVFAGFVLFFVGCVVGWFKELAASLFIFGGTLLHAMVALLVPGGFRRILILIVPTLLGVLFLRVHLTSKKK